MDLTNSKAAFIGIDVSCAKRKRIPIVFAVKEKNRLVPVSVMTLPIKPPFGPGNDGVINNDMCHAYADLVRDYIVNVCSALNLKPHCIAIDSPLKPRSGEVEKRVAEQQLNRAGISCYKTPSADEFLVIKEKAQAHLHRGGKLSNIPHSMQLWMLAGFEMAEKLRGLCPIIEVYPQATIREILPNVFHKTKRGVAEEKLNAIAQFTGWPTTEEANEINYIAAGSLHDRVDAYSAAWVASLSDDERDVFGDISKNDAIHIPAKHLTRNQPEISPTLSSDRNTNSTPFGIRKECPACKNFEFKRWPLGWDSHSAHKCSAAVGDTPEERKRWYKSRFLMR